ncbi:MAG: hypothetical protein M3378_04425 [Actinomycetota bacterium]|nr:hypothetical protein [Actinomycetota bacterium]MDQ3679785.1 hypothetical protein [Actinomycetota bacterium]
MVTNPAPDLRLAPVGGADRTLRQWLTSFDLVFVAVDPLARESRWILPTAERVLTNFYEADCRVAWLVAGDPDECREFLGEQGQRLLAFSDPERSAIAAFGLERLPALVHVGADGAVVGAAEGWQPSEWRAVVNRLAKDMAWIPPTVPEASDPGPFEGSPARR